MKPIRVLIVDDHALVRAGLRLLIDNQPDMAVVAEASDGSTAVQQAALARPNVATLDITMPAGGGIKIIEKLRQACAPLAILVLTMHDDEAYLRAALAGGANGYLVKNAADSDLLTGIRTVHYGRPFVLLDARLEQTPIPGPTSDGTPEQKSLDSLSERERAVLLQLAHGRTNKEIAEQLFVSIKTVETYRTRIGRKLGLQHRGDFIRFGVEMGLLTPGQ